MSTAATTTAFAAETQDSISTQITCDGSGKINNTTYKAYKEILDKIEKSTAQIGRFFVCRKILCVFCKTVFFVNLLST
ncbi:MAG: hypothetical protein II574_01835 [Ruminococcus sp.]|nr:hypothetical protein [Ruminococcus sp.]